MKVLPCGAEAVLAQFDSLDEALAFDAALAAGPVPGVLECVPAARTVLVCFDPSVIGADFLAAQLRRVSTRPPAVRRAAAPAPVEIPVRYDGPDLDLVAAHLGWRREEVVARHTGSVWRVGFVGFSPGFAYLVGTADLAVPRRAEPRLAVPAGSVALAGEYCGIYPRVSPGGWQLIGSTDATLWEPSRSEPALLTPGLSVRFVAVGS